jgi:hypothetical protein
VSRVPGRSGERGPAHPVAATVTVAGLAGIAGAISYSQMRQLAQAHGQVGWQAHAFPLSVDGVEIVASLVLLTDRRAKRRSGWFAMGRASYRHRGEPGCQCGDR